MGTEGLGLEITELRLGLTWGATANIGISSMEKNETKGGVSEINDLIITNNQVVGWPPIKSTIKRYVGRVIVTCAKFCMTGEGLEDADSNEYVPIYEDRDGDWMLLGDVPREMFMESCKRLRIMMRADASGIGLHVKNILKMNKNF